LASSANWVRPDRAGGLEWAENQAALAVNPQDPRPGFPGFVPTPTWSRTSAGLVRFLLAEPTLDELRLAFRGRGRCKWFSPTFRECGSGVTGKPAHKKINRRVETLRNGSLKARWGECGQSEPSFRTILRSASFPFNPLLFNPGGSNGKKNPIHKMIYFLSSREKLCGFCTCGLIVLHSRRAQRLLILGDKKSSNPNNFFFTK
jgi:hypothetical protein